MNAARACDWQSPHPPPVERAARRLAELATGTKYTTPPGCYVREACRRMHESGCVAEQETR
jgi:hypothetical protein